MSDKSSASAAGASAGAPPNASAQGPAAGGAADAAAAAAAKKPPPPQNPALKMMGLPRFRLPSRNWMIFWTITGSFAGTIIYDKWQTRRTREKWCNLVAHLAEEQLPTTTLPRKLTIYLAAPPGDGLRSAREHFYTYVKPILVAAAMDWDVVEGRKEGDVRHKTAERIRKRRRRNGEGEPLTEEEQEAYAVDDIRVKNGHVEFPGTAGDIVIGRHTWKEYLRGLHEGYLGPANAPKEAEDETKPHDATPTDSPGHSSLGDAAVKTAADLVASPNDSAAMSVGASPEDEPSTQDGQMAEQSSADGSKLEDKSEDKPEEKKEEEKPKRRFPASYILPDSYASATPSASMPEIIGPSAEIRFPHLLGIRNTPTRIYRFLTRRKLADDVGRQVAGAVLASYRSYGVASAVDDNSASDSVVDVPEEREVLAFEERDWFKTVHQPRQEHEESVWIEPVAIDERVSTRMRTFQLTADDEERAKRLKAGIEKPKTHSEDDA